MDLFVVIVGVWRYQYVRRVSPRSFYPQFLRTNFAKMTTQEEQLKRQIHDLQKEVERLQSQIKHQQYGLVWLDVPEAFDTESENKIPILEEVTDKAICHDDGKPTHILIEGDNYHALTCLNYTHKGKVDVIYIDPPYNTGKDFKYEDKRVLYKHIDGDPIIGQNHPLRHSSWLSFMSKRLELAKNLLSPVGCIMLSIDSYEYAQLRLLADKVFGQKNFVADFCVIRAEGGGLAKQVIKGHDNCLVYAKDIACFHPFAKTKDIRGKIIERDGIQYWIQEDWLRKEFGKYGNCHYEEVEKYKGYDFKKDIDNGLTDGRYILIPKPNGLHIIGKLRRVDADSSKFYSVLKHLNKDGVNELKDMGIDFDYPKPLSLIKELVGGATFFHKKATILDFFAGSGTTLHATMKLNEQDGGKRQCILCQINEGDICTDVTYERNKRVMNGYTDSKGNEIEGLGNSLKYYRTAFVGKNNPQKATDEDKLVLAKKAGCLLALAENTLYEQKCTDFYQVYSDGKGRYTAIYFQEDYTAYEEFLQEVKGMEGKRTVYVFSWGTGEEFGGDFEGMNDVTLRGIPQPILDIYKSLNQ